MPLDLVQDLDETLERVAANRPLVPPGILGDLGVEPPDPDRELDRGRVGRTLLGGVEHVGGGNHQYLRSIGM
jgi:hypothetical protein